MMSTSKEEGRIPGDTLLGLYDTFSFVTALEAMGV